MTLAIEPIAKAKPNRSPVNSLDVRSAIVEARAAGAKWNSFAIRNRIKIFRTIRHTLAASATEIGEELAAEKNASLADVLAAEILPVLDAIHFIERNLKRALKPVRHNRRGRPGWLFGITLTIHREPLGAVLVIGPSNYPFFLSAVQALQALAVGNAVLIKPAANGARAVEKLVAICENAGVPRGAIVALESSIAIATESIPLVDHVVFTGSRTAGIRVNELAAKHGVATTLELSGHDAVFVLPDADLELVARSLRFGLTFNRSETCIAPRRVFAQRAIIEMLSPMLRSECESLNAQPIPAPAAQRARDLVDDAIARGARLLCGHIAEKMKPIILVNVPESARICREDVFAPLVAIIPVESINDAIRMNGECAMGLGASIFSRDATAAMKLAKRVNAGCVVINDVIAPTADPRLPFAARGASGFGVTRGLDGMLAMTRIKAIARRGGGKLAHPHLDPPASSDASMFANWIGAAHGKSVAKRARSLVRFLKIAIARR